MRGWATPLRVCCITCFSDTDCCPWVSVWSLSALLSTSRVRNTPCSSCSTTMHSSSLHFSPLKLRFFFRQHAAIDAAGSHIPSHPGSFSMHATTDVKCPKLTTIRILPSFNQIQNKNSHLSLPLREHTRKLQPLGFLFTSQHASKATSISGNHPLGPAIPRAR
jgi:hypothetical protein